jgi:uncharacterized protein YkwD
MRRSTLRTAVVLAASLAVLLLAPGPTTAAADSCAAASASAKQVKPKRLRLATLCLLNRARRRHGLRRVRVDPRLRLAARRHARDMLFRRYFAHFSVTGSSPWDRIRAAGYMRPGQRWLVGENLAWGTGRASTPFDRTRALLQSPSHRANMLHRRFREVGIWVTPRVPWQTRHGQGAIYVLDFGFVR